MRKSSKLFGLLLAAGFLAALGWALVAQSNLWRAHARPVNPHPTQQPALEETPKAEESATGVYGTVEEGTAKALEKHLQAQRDARKRLDAPPQSEKRP